MNLTIFCNNNCSQGITSKNAHLGLQGPKGPVLGFSVTVFPVVSLKSQPAGPLSLSPLRKARSTGLRRAGSSPAARPPRVLALFDPGGSPYGPALPGAVINAAPTRPNQPAGEGQRRYGCGDSARPAHGPAAVQPPAPGQQRGRSAPPAAATGVSVPWGAPAAARLLSPAVPYPALPAGLWRRGRCGRQPPSGPFRVGLTGRRRESGAPSRGSRCDGGCRCRWRGGWRLAGGGERPSSGGGGQGAGPGCPAVTSRLLPRGPGACAEPPPAPARERAGLRGPARDGETHRARDGARVCRTRGAGASPRTLGRGAGRARVSALCHPQGRSENSAAAKMPIAVRSQNVIGT